MNKAFIDYEADACLVQILHNLERLISAEQQAIFY